MTAGLKHQVFAKLDALCGNAGRVALGYSGGGDSHALLHLTRAWAEQRGVILHALIVDHALRPESAAEAARAVDAARAAGVTPRLLHWDGARGGSAIQERARAARHELLARACRALDCQHLLLGHTRDDQAETVLMRLRSGAHWPGLAGMSGIDVSPSWPHGYGLRVVRPLLDVGRDELRCWLEAGGQNWVEDPSNQDQRFTRIRLRRALQQASPDVSLRLAGLASILDQARQLHRRQCRRAIDRHVRFTNWGGAELDSHALSALEAGLRRSVLAVLAQAVSGGARAVGGGALDSLESALTRRETGTGAGVLLAHEGEIGWIIRDPGAVLGRVDRTPRPDDQALCRETHVWDGRLLYPRGESVEVLGGAYMGLEQRDALAEIPGFARASLPCFRRKGIVISIPGLLGADAVQCRFLVADRVLSRLLPADPSCSPVRSGVMCDG